MRDSRTVPDELAAEYFFRGRWLRIPRHTRAIEHAVAPEFKWI